MRSALALLLVGCGAAAPAPQLAALPAASPAATDRFPGVVTCVRCHTAGEHGAMRDGSGADISPVTDAAAGMMALAARDPYYLAAFRRELLAAPAGAAAIADTCTRCHAPVGYAEAKATGGALTLDALVAATTPAAALGREGIGCAGCHALEPDTLGTDEGFTGRAPLRADRAMYGALPAPAGDAMVAMIKSVPVPSSHVTKSELCASCHTVIVRALDASGRPAGDEVAEQATFLEWRSSSYADGATAQTCQDCHLPETAAPTPFATRPPTSPPREHFRRHAVRGGNAYLLARLADAASWLGAGLTAAQLTAAARDTARLLGTAARLDVAPVTGGLAVTVVNLTGHKLPTGYPTRRMWLHVTARDASGRVVLESGRSAAGAITTGSGARLDGPGVILPHVDRIARGEDVAIWEAVPVDAAGRRTHLLLGTARLAKDDRILPAGYQPTGRDAARTRPIGADGDASFVAGRDTVTVALPAGTARVDVELLYQAIPPETLESYRPADSLEAARFLAIAARPPEPDVLATASWAAAR